MATPSPLLATLRCLLPYVQGYFQLQPQVYFKKCAVYGKILIIFATY